MVIKERKRSRQEASMLVESLESRALMSASFIARLGTFAGDHTVGPTQAWAAIAVGAMQVSPISGLSFVDNGDLRLDTFRGTTTGYGTLDGKVDSFDLNVLAPHWQQPAGSLWSAGDFNGDGTVDAFDLILLAANWQSVTAPLAEPVLAQATGGSTSSGRTPVASSDPRVTYIPGLQTFAGDTFVGPQL